MKHFFFIIIAVNITSSAMEKGKSEINPNCLRCQYEKRQNWPASTPTTAENFFGQIAAEKNSLFQCDVPKHKSFKTRTRKRKKAQKNNRRRRRQRKKKRNALKVPLLSPEEQEEQRRMKKSEAAVCNLVREQKKQKLLEKIKPYPNPYAALSTLDYATFEQQPTSSNDGGLQKYVENLEKGYSPYEGFVNERQKQKKTSSISQWKYLEQIYKSMSGPLNPSLNNFDCDSLENT